MPCIFSDIASVFDATNTPQPVVRGVITATPTQVPVQIAVAGVFRPAPAAGPSVTTGTDGSWSLTLPWPSESLPTSLQWLVRLTDGTQLIGTVPQGVTGPLSVNALLTSYGWAAVVQSGPVMQTVAVAGPVGPTGAAGPDAQVSAVGAVLIDVAPASGHPIAATKPTTDALSARLGHLAINVKDAPYNAVGDGVANDTVALQAALTAVHTAGGGIVFLPPGTYAVSAVPDTVPVTPALLVYANTTVQGAGPDATTIRIVSPSGCIMGNYGPTQYPTLHQDSNITLCDLTIDLNSTVCTDPLSFPHFGQVTNFVARAVHVIHPYGIGFVVNDQGNINCRLEKCVFDGTGQNVAGTYDLVDFGNGTDMTLVQCRFQNAVSGPGLSSAFNTGLRIESCTATGCGNTGAGAPGFDILGCSDVTMINCDANTNYGGILITPGGTPDGLEGQFNTTILDCRCYNNTGYGITAIRTDQRFGPITALTVMDCQVHDNGTNGIQIESVSSASVVGNQCYNNSGVGVGAYYGIALAGLPKVFSLAAAVIAAGAQTVAVSSAQQLAVGDVIHVSGAGAENITLTAVNSGANTITATFAGTHLNGVSCSVTTDFFVDNQEILIAHNMIFDTRATPKQIYGIGLFNSDYVTVRGNEIYNCATGAPINIGGSGGLHMVVQDNRGYNPLGQLTVTALATVGSGVEYNDNAHVNRTYYIIGGTVTAIAVGPPGATVATGLTAGTVVVPVTQVIKVTFTGTPTWVAIGQ